MFLVLPTDSCFQNCSELMTFGHNISDARPETCCRHCVSELISQCLTFKNFVAQLRKFLRICMQKGRQGNICITLLPGANVINSKLRP